MTAGWPTTNFHDDMVAAPTSTTLATVDVRDTRLVAVSVKNLDAAQTVTVVVQKRAHSADDFAPGPALDEFTDIPPLTQRSVDIDVAAQMEIQVLGTASGIGASTRVTVRPDGGRR